MSKKIELFRAGDYPGKGRFTRAHLDEMVANFSPNDQVPLVVGHPKEDSPAYGWLSKVWREGDSLFAEIGYINPTLQQAIKEQKFKNRSISVGKTQKGWKVKHLGFLGGVLPAVEGMQPLKAFSDKTESVVVEFSLPAEPEESNPMKDEKKGGKTPPTQDDLDAAKAALKKSQQETQEARKEAQEVRDTAKKEQFSNWFKAQSKAGRASGAKESEVVGFLMALPEGKEAQFSLGDGVTSADPVKWFQSYVENQPVAKFSQPLPDGPGKEGESQEFTDLSGKV